MKSALLLTLLLAAAPAAATAARHPAAPPPAPAPISKDGLQITILPMIGKIGGPNAVTEVGLDLETTSADVAGKLGFTSLHAITDVDCGKGANRFVSAETFEQLALAGPARSRSVTGQWMQPTADSYMAAVIARVCAAPVVETHAAPASSSRLPVVREMAAAPPPAPKPAPPPAPLPSPPPAAVSATTPAAPAPEAAAPAPAPSPPLVVKFSGGVPSAAPPAHAAPAAAAPTPAASPPAPSGPLVVKFGGAPSDGAASAPSPAAASSTPSYIPRTAGDRVAQVTASPSQHDAEKVLRQLRGLIAPPLTTSIEQAQVGAAHVWRADVVGFATAADAKAFCRAAAHLSKTCWVRAKGDTAAPKPAEHLRAVRRGG